MIEEGLRYLCTRHSEYSFIWTGFDFEEHSGEIVIRPESDGRFTAMFWQEWEQEWVECAPVDTLEQAWNEIFGGGE
jgi:hypothetical protein